MIRHALAATLLPLYLSGCTSIPEKSEIDGYTIETKDVEAQPGLSTRKKVRPADLSAEFSQNLPATFAYASQKGGQVAGQPFAIYHSHSAEEIDVEFGCPLEKAIAGDANIKSMTVPGGWVAVTTHYGAYHDLVKAHAAMDKWFETHGATRNGPAWEVYVDDPTSVEPEKVRTLVYYPIK